MGTGKERTLWGKTWKFCPDPPAQNGKCGLSGAVSLADLTPRKPDPCTSGVCLHSRGKQVPGLAGENTSPPGLPCGAGLEVAGKDEQVPGQHGGVNGPGLFKQKAGGSASQRGVLKLLPQQHFPLDKIMENRKPRR